MAGKNRIKWTFKRTNPVTKAAILAAVVLSLAALLALYGAVDRLQADCEARRDAAMELESDNAQLKGDIAALGTLDSALRIAMEELGLVFPDSVIFTPGN